MAGNKVYRGPVDKTPKSVTAKAAAALISGTFVEKTATGFVQLTTAKAKLPLVLAEMELMGAVAGSTIASGETCYAFELQVGDKLNVAMAAGTYALNAPLTIAAGGRLAAPVAGDVVVAFYQGPTTAITAGTLADVTVANAYTVPA